MNTEEIFKQSGYTIPTDKHDECSKRFDYWDMIAFADLAIEKQQEQDSNLYQHLVIGCDFKIEEISTMLTSVMIAKDTIHTSLAGYDRMEKVKVKLMDITTNHHNR